MFQMLLNAHVNITMRLSYLQKHVEKLQKNGWKVCPSRKFPVDAHVYYGFTCTIIMAGRGFWISDRVYKLVWWITGTAELDAANPHSSCCTRRLQHIRGRPDQFQAVSLSLNCLPKAFLFRPHSASPPGIIIITCKKLQVIKKTKKKNNLSA